MVLRGAFTVFVGDGQKALFLRNAGDATLLNLTTEHVFTDENPPTHEQGTDRPGRTFQSAAKNKRSYWTGGKVTPDPEQWLASAHARPGSWWTHWAEWIKPLSGREVPARKKLGNARHKPIEAAPGRYVKVRVG